MNKLLYIVGRRRRGERKPGVEVNIHSILLSEKGKTEAVLHDLRARHSIYQWDCRS
jgi:hypothetical protein